MTLGGAARAGKHAEAALGLLTAALLLGGATLEAEAQDTPLVLVVERGDSAFEASELRRALEAHLGRPVVNLREAVSEATPGGTLISVFVAENRAIVHTRRRSELSESIDLPPDAPDQLRVLVEAIARQLAALPASGPDLRRLGLLPWQPRDADFDPAATLLPWPAERRTREPRPSRARRWRTERGQNLSAPRPR